MASINTSMGDVLGAPPLHPYYPLGVEIPGFVAKVLTTQEILTIFTTTCLAILVPAWLYTRYTRHDLPASEVFVVLWFVLCGFIHLGLEGYFARHALDIAGRSTVLAQAWKEYALSDSRYLTADSFVVCMEAVTALFWGPLSFACAWCALRAHPLRHPLQSVVSLGQLYGDVLYYATCAFDSAHSGLDRSRPEPAYFWGYYVFLNAIWIVVPLALLVSSTRETARAFAAVARARAPTRTM
ncbi:putative emopamil binding protein [Rosellinia necatrix]|uniref:Putative emopamil binding protein n=1 Tax=Rosellinia necatrix TaxID=77044 RepID=A0A1W2TH24_ROSNE|nr:putative emopamil binding protein [Rosellinia necatrix]